MIDYFKILPQRLVPHHFYSRMMGKLGNLTRPIWLKNFLIRLFIKRYGVNMEEALNADPESYVSFNSFFTRKLQSLVHTIDKDPAAIVSPADGTLSESGRIDGTKLIQAKGHDFHLIDLLGGDKEQAALFENGHFATIYLAPKDYHRVHMPISGTLKEMVHIPGNLFSVNQRTANLVPDLFARNERVVSLFQTEAGTVAVILVGAMIVSSIVVSWAGVVTPPQQQAVRRWHYDSKTLFDKGAELGYFQLGSTVILLFQPNQIDWSRALSSGKAVRVGQGIGLIQSKNYAN